MRILPRGCRITSETLPEACGEPPDQGILQRGLCWPAATGPRPPEGGPPGQATHKIERRSVADVDGKVLHLVRVACDQN